MTIHCLTQELHAAIDVVSRCLAPRPAKESYAYIQIEADESTITVSATDGAVHMVANIEVQGGDIEEPGVIALDGKLLAAVIQKQQDGRIRLASNGRSCTIQCGKAKTQLPLRPVEDFPDMPPVSPKCKSAKITQRDLKACIDYVSFCTSTEQARKVLTGILMEFTDNQLKTVALDGFRAAMIKVKCDFSGEEIKCVVPKESAVEISRLITDSDDPVSIRMDKQYLHIWAGKITFSTVLITGEYIDYHRLIRPDCKTKALIDARQLRGSVERAQVMASNGKNDLIHFSFSGNELEITSHSENGASHDELDIGLQGEPLEIAFNVRYLIDMLKHEPDGQIDVECYGNVSPAIIRPLDNDTRIQLVLPVRRSGKAAAQ